MNYEIKISTGRGAWHQIHNKLSTRIYIEGILMAIAFLDDVPEWWIIQDPEVRNSFTNRSIEAIGPFDSAATALVHLKLIET